MINKKWKEIFSDNSATFLTDGIFSALGTLAVPWAESQDAQTLNLAYYGKTLNKRASPIILTLLGTYTLAETMELAAQSIFAINSTKWAKLWATLSLDYNPISNYDMTETEKTDGSNTGTSNQTNATTQEQSRTNSSSGYDNNLAFGFESTTATNTDAVQREDLTGETSDGSSTTTATGNTSGAYDESRTLTRSGNIGVTTSQQMIESERELWRWKFFDEVFDDVGNFLNLKIY